MVVKGSIFALIVSLNESIELIDHHVFIYIEDNVGNVFVMN